MGLYNEEGYQWTESLGLEAIQQTESISPLMENTTGQKFLAALFEVSENQLVLT